MLEVAAEAGQYRLQRIPLCQAGDSILADWRSLRARQESDAPLHDPEWLRGYFQDYTDQLFVYALYRSGGLCGVASFLQRDWPLKWHLGHYAVARFPLTRLRLLGEVLGVADEEAAYDQIFSELAASHPGVDAISLEEIPLDSFLWRYLSGSELVRKRFLLYQPEPPSPHLILRVEGSFEQYMGKFSSKHRKNLNRAVRKIRQGELGEMQFVRFERPEEVSEFLEQAVAISRKTYQWVLHGRGLSATDLLRKRLLFAAGRGWMRSYLLVCGGTACAFVVGFQYAGRFLLHEIGFDPALARYSVGTVLQLLMVEDLFEYNRASILDLGDYGEYKAMLSTESYLQGKMLLFRPGAHARLIRAGHRCCRSVTKAVGSVLERFHWKAKLKNRVRGWAGPQ